MNFLNPAALWAAAVFLPILVVLYLLRLRRKPVTVGSTMLWRRAVEDLSANTLLQRLRANILMVLQALVLSLVVGALAAPGCESADGGGRSVIIVIDVSASMGATDAPGGAERLEFCKQQCIRLLDGLWTREEAGRGTGKVRPPDEAMLVAFADRAELVSPFTRDIAGLREAVRGLKVSQAGSKLGRALELVRGQSENRSNPASVVIFTDGRVERDARLGITAAEIEVVCPPSVPDGKENLGIALFSVVRTTDGQGTLQAVATLVNAADRPVKTGLRVLLDGRPMEEPALPAVTVPARKPGPDAGDGQPAVGMLPLRFTLPPTVGQGAARRPVAGVITLEIERADILAADNRASDIVPPPHRPKVAVITAGPQQLRLNPVAAAFKAVAFADVDVLAGTAPTAEGLTGEDGLCRFDTVVFDGVTPPKGLPPGRYLTFGVLPPEAAPAMPPAEAGDPAVRVNWLDVKHPVLADVHFDGVSIYKALDWTPPDWGRPVAEGAFGGRSIPLITELTREGRTWLACSFAVNPRAGAVVNTDWWIQPGFAVFAENAILYLGRRADTRERKVAPGEPLEVVFEPSVKEAALTLPDGTTRTLPAVDGRVQFGGTVQTGVYTLVPKGGGGAGATERFAVNLADPWESDTAPLPDGKLPIDHEGVTVKDAAGAARTDGWRTLLWVALGLVMAEWVIYTRKVRI